MERAKAIHTIIVEMTTGMLVLATLAVGILAWIALFGGDRQRRLRDASDAVVLFGTTIGVPMLLLAMFSGLRQWPVEAVLHGAIVQNKILTATIALCFWGTFLFFRLVGGRRVWERRVPALYGLVLALGGFAFLVFTASIGGSLASKPSGFEELVRTFVETRQTFVLPMAANLLLLSVGTLLPIAVFLRRKRK
jgi:hypothetical protein